MLFPIGGSSIIIDHFKTLNWKPFLELLLKERINIKSHLCFDFTSSTWSIHKSKQNPFPSIVKSLMNRLIRFDRESLVTCYGIGCSKD